MGDVVLDSHGAHVATQTASAGPRICCYPPMQKTKETIARAAELLRVFRASRDEACAWGGSPKWLRLAAKTRDVLAVASRLEQPSVVGFLSLVTGCVLRIVGPIRMSGSNASDLAGKLTDRRKLIAVMYTDIISYDRLIGLDDAGTLQRLRTLRREVIDPPIEEHGRPDGPDRGRLRC